MIYVMSGSAPLYAIIAVTYPSGSICTCGGKKANDTSGYALFNVKAGTYTVKVEVLSNGSYVTAATYTATVTTDGGTGTVNIGKLAAGNARITCGSKTVLA